jgi:hypothetical protein
MSGLAAAMTSRLWNRKPWALTFTGFNSKIVEQQCDLQIVEQEALAESQPAG